MPAPGYGLPGGYTRHPRRTIPLGREKERAFRMTDMTEHAGSTDQVAINTIRFLSDDMVEKAQSGHPGAPLGQAPLAYLLWTRTMRHNPDHPDWPNRDRFVLSCGHASALLYSLLHLAGYGLPMEELQRFRQFGSKTPGHPEHELTRGVETTIDIPRLEHCETCHGSGSAPGSGTWICTNGHSTVMISPDSLTSTGLPGTRADVRATAWRGRSRRAPVQSSTAPPGADAATRYRRRNASSSSNCATSPWRS